MGECTHLYGAMGLTGGVSRFLLREAKWQPQASHTCGNNLTIPFASLIIMAPHYTSSWGHLQRIEIKSSSLDCAKWQPCQLYYYNSTITTIPEYRFLHYNRIVSSRAFRFHLGIDSLVPEKVLLQDDIFLGSSDPTNGIFLRYSSVLTLGKDDKLKLNMLHISWR